MASVVLLTRVSGLQEEFSPRFFLPDGSRNVTLKDTIANALKRTKWDSVSTLLAERARTTGGALGACARAGAWRQLRCRAM